MRTLKKVLIEPVYVEFIPEILEENKLYISVEYKVCCHLCFCGCKTLCCLPLKPTEWVLSDSNGKVSLTPSILQRFNCRSHYIITNNIVNFV